MKIAISVASILVCVFSLDAQVTASLKSLPDGTQEIRIRNDSVVSLVAFAVYAKPATQSGANQGPLLSSRPLVTYFDPLIDPDIKPLQTGEERVAVQPMMMFARSAARADRKGRSVGTPIVFEEPILAAGVFADGGTSGDAPLLARLVLRRCNMLQAVETALETLLDAGGHNVPRDQLIGQFKRLADSVRHWYLPPEQQIGLRVYQPIIGRLMNLPPEQVGSPFPPTSFVAHEAAILNRQRVTLLESQPGLADAALIRAR